MVDASHRTLPLDLRTRRGRLAARRGAAAPGEARCRHAMTTRTLPLGPLPSLLPLLPLLMLAAACARGDTGARTDSAAGPVAPSASSTRPADSTAMGSATGAADSARRPVPRKHGPLPPRAANALTEEDVQEVVDMI